MLYLQPPRLHCKSVLWSYAEFLEKRSREHSGGYASAPQADDDTFTPIGVAGIAVVRTLEQSRLTVNRSNAPHVLPREAA